MIFFLLDMVARRFQDKDLIPLFIMVTNFEGEREGKAFNFTLCTTFQIPPRWKMLRPAHPCFKSIVLDHIFSKLELQ